MTERQLEALGEIVSGPRKLNAATGEALVRRGLADRERGRVFVATDEGRRVIERRRHEKALRALEVSLSKEDRERRDRALGWLDFIGQLTFDGRLYAKTCLAALIREVAPPASGRGWGEEGDARVLEHARIALGATFDVDEVRRKAKARGGEAVIQWTVEEPNPIKARETRRAAVLSAEVEEGVVELERYRAERSA